MHSKGTLLKPGRKRRMYGVYEPYRAVKRTVAWAPEHVELSPRLRHLRRHALVIGRQNGADFPWREHPTPYSVIVAEVLLQHTPSPRVIPVFERIVARWSGFRALASAPIRDLESLL